MYEKSAGCVVFIEKAGKRFYLLLHKEASGNYKESWAFPKGIVEQGEEEKQTALRETEEEAGITDLQILPGFRENVHYVYKKEGQFVSKDVIYFLAKTTQSQAKVSEEHSGFEWLPYDKAMERLTHKTDKEILDKCEAYLQKATKENLSKFF